MNYFLRVRDAAGGGEGAGASEERTSTEAKRTPKQPDPNCRGKPHRFLKPMRFSSGMRDTPKIFKILRVFCRQSSREQCNKMQWQ